MSVVMPGRGRTVSRPYSAEELATLAEGAAAQGRTLADFLACLGESTRDVYLNDRACWRNVPERVWQYTLGGYQVLKKWLSYRERIVLGRALQPEEVQEFERICRRIAALLLLEPELDASYRRVKAAVYRWPQDRTP